MFSKYQRLNDVPADEWDNLKWGKLVEKDVGSKFDDGKPRMDLITKEMLEGLSAPLSFGVKKYDANNWRKGLAYSRVTGAALRHLSSWMSGIDIDEESGLNHIDQAFLNLGFLVTFEREGRRELDDRHKR